MVLTHFKINPSSVCNQSPTNINIGKPFVNDHLESIGKFWRFQQHEYADQFSCVSLTERRNTSLFSQLDEMSQRTDNCPSIKQNFGPCGNNYSRNCVEEIVALPDMNAMPTYISKLDSIIKSTNSFKAEDHDSITIVNPDLSVSSHMEPNSHRADNVQTSPLKKVLKAPLPFLRKGSRSVKSVPPSTPPKKYRYYSAAVQEMKVKKSQIMEEASARSPISSYGNQLQNHPLSQASNHSNSKIIHRNFSNKRTVTSCESMSTRLNSCSQENSCSSTSAVDIKGLTEYNKVTTDLGCEGLDNNQSLQKKSSITASVDNISSDELEVLAAQARAKLAMVDEQLAKLQSIQQTLNYKTYLLEQETVQWEKDKEHQRLKLAAEKETFLLELEKKKEDLQKKFSKMQYSKEDLSNALAICKKKLEDENQQLKLTIVQLQTDLSTKDERYRKIIDRLQNLNYLLERKNKSLTENLAVQEEQAWSAQRLSEHRKFMVRTGINKKLVSTSKSSDAKSSETVKTPKISYFKNVNKPSMGISKVKLSEKPREPQAMSGVGEPVLNLQSNDDIQENFEEVNVLLQSEYADILNFDPEAAWKPFDQALCQLNSIDAQEQIGNTITKADGRLEKLYKDGHREVLFANGFKKIVCPNGWIFYVFVNKDIRGVDPLGYIYYYYFVDKIYNIQTPDGRSYNSFPDNQIDCFFPDGKLQVRFPQGYLKQIDSDGVEHIQKIKNA